MSTKKLNKGSAGQNRKLSEQFLDKFRRKADAIVLPSGLIYRVLEAGTGPCPEFSDKVSVHQRILTADGKVISDTYKTGLADSFLISEAIAGLQEGLLLCQLGGRYEFAIPPELAWGKRGANNKIGPNAVLLFDIRLLDFEFNED
ncbi:FKBP-type peptidyl-prolyl cis-trans isomerase [Teredinibacter waterburyi]|jgi:FKBP-type peptidyl-prolyl cis-trans isomerases 1|uniref:FKBP-type peptidyl-prolyl cis-trans isomerase n=1 Tax=Teredinibacter waterburyi TaxID=1500538 RepID=UPI00165ECA75|nr:FKBP-type peptidyl-prolyl cis-trans isomerase [Teredinibacter waterburyi]